MESRKGTKKITFMIIILLCGLLMSSFVSSRRSKIAIKSEIKYFDYTVLPGETLGIIAHYFYPDKNTWNIVNDIEEKNNITAFVKSGQDILIPIYEDNKRSN